MLIIEAFLLYSFQIWRLGRCYAHGEDRRESGRNCGLYNSNMANSLEPAPPGLEHFIF